MKVVKEQFKQKKDINKSLLNLKSIEEAILKAETLDEVKEIIIREKYGVNIR